MKVNSMNLEFFTGNEASFPSQLIPVCSCYSAVSAGQTLQTSEAGVSPLRQSAPNCLGAGGWPGSGI